MDECFRCGKSGEITPLFDVISNEGIKKICRDCVSEENLPVIRKPTNLKLSHEKPEQQSVYQRLSRAAGIDPEKHNQKQQVSEEYQKKQDELKAITNRRFREKVRTDKAPEGLKENFHWRFMRSRRLRKISHKALAEKIREPEDAIKMLEKGIVPEDYISLIRKIEKALNIELFEPEFRERLEARLPSYIDFENRDFSNIKIEDLRKMQGQEEPYSENQGEDLDKESQEEHDQEKDKKSRFSLKRFFKKKNKESSSEDQDISEEELEEILNEDQEKDKTRETSSNKHSESKSQKDNSEEKDKTKRTEVSQEEIDRLIYGKK